MNQDAILNMLQMQHRMNSRVHEDWINQHFEWYRAIWIECGELMDHVGYKWWKKQTPDMEQVRLEVVDIWHFGLSALFEPDTDLEILAAEIADDFTANAPSESRDYGPSQRIHAATEALAQHAPILVSKLEAWIGACNVRPCITLGANASAGALPHPHLHPQHPQHHHNYHHH